MVPTRMSILRKSSNAMLLADSAFEELMRLHLQNERVGASPSLRQGRLQGLTRTGRRFSRPGMDLQQETRQIRGLQEISSRYDVIFCDIWGVVHNGVAAFPSASAALSAFRGSGGTVVLITNAPRPSAPVHRQLLKLGVSADGFDAVATSGDVTVELIKELIDEPVLHIGPLRDLGLFEAAAETAGRPPRRVALGDARYAVCTGLRDDVQETAADYEVELRHMARRGLTMICANPDIVIHRGEQLIYCAGAIARKYEETGGLVVYAGKPHAPIYELATALAEKARGSPVRRERILAIGDGMNTHIAGAVGAGLDALLVTQGIHRDALHGESLQAFADPDKLHRLCEAWRLWPIAAIGALQD